MSDLRVRVHDNLAIVTGAYHEKGTSKGKPYENHDRFTDVWIKNPQAGTFLPRTTPPSAE
jgi:ketosteroid isomerase-like protein